MYRISSNKRLGAYSKIDFGRMAFGGWGEALNRGGAYSNIDRKDIEDFLKTARILRTP